MDQNLLHGVESIAPNIEGFNRQLLTAPYHLRSFFLSSFERRDIHFAADRYRVERGPTGEGARFVAIYDQTYGSLHLSARVLEERRLIF